MRAPVGRAGQHGVGPGLDLAVRLPRLLGHAVHVVEQVLLHEPARVQVLEIEVLELRAEPFPQVRLRTLRDAAQVAQRAACLLSNLRQLVRAEDDERDHREDQQLGQRKVKHSALRQR